MHEQSKSAMAQLNDLSESLSSLWFVILGAGGYVIAVVQFFKTWLEIRKLELDIAQLKKQLEAQPMIQVATAQEIEIYGNLRARKQDRKQALSTIVLGVPVLCLLALAFPPVRHEIVTRLPEIAGNRDEPVTSYTLQRLDQSIECPPGSLTPAFHGYQYALRDANITDRPFTATIDVYDSGSKRLAGSFLAIEGARSRVNGLYATVLQISKCSARIYLVESR